MTREELSAALAAAADVQSRRVNVVRIIIDRDKDGHLIELGRYVSGSFIAEPGWRPPEQRKEEQS